MSDVDAGIPAGQGAGDDEVLIARAYLSRVAESASIPVWDWVRRLGPVQAAASIRAGDIPPDVAAATSARRDFADPESDLDAGSRHGMRLVVPESPDWPHFAMAALEGAARARLQEYRAGTRRHREGGEPVPPLALWVKGTAELSTAALRSVAIVGSRASTAYGEHVTAELAYGLASRAVEIVSGGAYGIDAVAHRGALAAGEPTFIVSAGGLDRPYPAGNASLYERVSEAGLLISESPPGAAPQRHRFLTRNRLIATLSTGTIVVEAAARSGALNTARHCQVLGRPLMVVPGPVTSAMSAGCHALLRRSSEPGLLVTSVDDVLAIVGSVGEGLPVMSREAPVDPADLRTVLDRLDPIARRVFDGMPVRQPAREDDLARRSGVSAVEVTRALPALRLAGLIESTDEGFRMAAPFRKRPSRDAR